MKYWNRFSLIAICYLLSSVFLGCATVKEMGKGFIGVSTQVLEEKRKDALKKSFVLDYHGCYVKVKEILKAKEKEKESPIYAEDMQKKMVAVYFSQVDTAPVGIFFTVEAENKTLIEVSSPSIYAKEEIANRIFTGIDELIKTKVEEKKINVKEKFGN